MGADLKYFDFLFTTENMDHSHMEEFIKFIHRNKMVISVAERLKELQGLGEDNIPIIIDSLRTMDTQLFIRFRNCELTLNEVRSRIKNKNNPGFVYVDQIPSVNIIYKYIFT